MSRKGEGYLFQFTGRAPLLMAIANMLMSSGFFSLTRGVPIMRSVTLSKSVLNRMWVSLVRIEDYQRQSDQH